MENGPRLDRGKNGKKMAQKRFLREFSIIFHFWAIFFAMFAIFVQLGAVFHFDFIIFSAISGFWPFSMPCQPGMIPNLGVFSKGVFAAPSVSPKNFNLQNAN